MKVRFFTFLLPLLFLIAATPAQAELIIASPPIQHEQTYTPQWQVGKTYRYQTEISYTYSSFFTGGSHFIANYKVISRTPNYTEFGVSVSDYSYQQFGETNKLNPKSQELLDQFVLYYKIDNNGKIIEITQMDKLVDFYSNLIAHENHKLTDDEKLGVQIIFNLFVNNSNYSFIPFSPYYGPHNNLYMGKKFDFSHPEVPHPMTFDTPPLFPFTLQPIHLELPGTTIITLDNTGNSFSSTHKFDQNISREWSQAVLDRLLLADQERKGYQKMLNDLYKDRIIKGTITNYLHTAHDNAPADLLETKLTIDSYTENDESKDLLTGFHFAGTIKSTLID